MHVCGKGSQLPLKIQWLKVSCVSTGAHVIGAAVLGRDEVEKETDKEKGPWVMFATADGYGKRVPLSEFNLQVRGGSGLQGYKFNGAPQPRL